MSMHASQPTTFDPAFADTVNELIRLRDLLEDAASGNNPKAALEPGTYIVKEGAHWRIPGGNGEESLPGRFIGSEVMVIDSHNSLDSEGGVMVFLPDGYASPVNPDFLVPVELDSERLAEVFYRAYGEVTPWTTIAWDDLLPAVRMAFWAGTEAVIGELR